MRTFSPYLVRRVLFFCRQSFVGMPGGQKRAGDGIQERKQHNYLKHDFLLADVDQ
jgi:hypothetical protein